MKLKLIAHYDKLALAFAVMISTGLGAAIYVDAGKLDRDFHDPRSAPPLGDPGPLPAAANPLDPAALLDGPNVFTGQRLHLKPDGTVVDLNDVEQPPVHPPIPNRWWRKHGLDPGPRDAPRRDPDRDGFSNLEEFHGETSPVRRTDHPPLVHKLRVAGLEKAELRVTYASDDCAGDPGPESSFGFRQEWIERRERQQPRRRRESDSGLKPGRGEASVFFRKGPGQLRFELDSVRRDDVLGMVATVIDRRPNKKGRRYEIRKGSQRGIVIRDYTATFYVDVPGRRNQRFEVEENESFALPGENEAARNHRLVEVQADEAGAKVVVEFMKDGEALHMTLPVPRP